MYSRIHRVASRPLLLAVTATFLVTGGPEALRTVAQASLVLTQISLELCQLGLSVLRVCGI